MKLPFNIQPKRTPLQERALKKAKELYDSDPEKYKDTMFCPYCGSPLIKSGQQRRMETLSEHVSDPNGTPSLKDEYVCSANGLFGHQYLFDDHIDGGLGCEFGILHSWNGGYEKGGSYASEFWHKLYKMSKESIINKRVIDAWLHEDYQHKHYAALNTFECNAQTSIYAEGLKKDILLPAWLTFNLIRLKLGLHYEANDFGEVTSTSVTLGFLKKDKGLNSCGFCIVGMWPWHTWSYLNKSAKRHFKLAKRITDEKERAKMIAKAMNICGNDDFIYRLHQDYMYLIHPKYAKLMKKYGYYKISTWKIR